MESFVNLAAALFALAMIVIAARPAALEADARHVYTDMWLSGGVVVGLSLVHLTAWLWLDPLIGIGVAANIPREGAHPAGRLVEGLMDTALEGGVREQIATPFGCFAKSDIRFDDIVHPALGPQPFR